MSMAAIASIASSMLVGIFLPFVFYMFKRLEVSYKNEVQIQIQRATKVQEEKSRESVSHVHRRIDEVETRTLEKIDEQKERIMAYEIEREWFKKEFSRFSAKIDSIEHALGRLHNDIISVLKKR